MAGVSSIGVIRQSQAELEKEYGAPLKHAVDIRALAADVERSVKRQLGRG